MSANRWIFAGLLMFGLGCGASAASTKALRPTSPFTDADARLFQDSVDLVADPEGLTGRWAQDWAAEMHDRIKRSDFIGLVTVNTVRSEVNPQQNTTYWLVAQVDDLLKGKAPGAGELSLPSSDEGPGFESVDRERSNLLRRPLLVFGKWVQEPSGELHARWHLSSASDQVVATVRAGLQREAGKSPSTIVERHYESTAP